MLRRSQPAVSRMIAALENEASVELFYRGGKNLRPTPAALELFEQVERVHSNMQELERKTKMLGDFAPTQITITSPPAFATRGLVDILENIRASCPDLQVVVLVRDPSISTDMVAEGAADIGFGMPGYARQLDKRPVCDLELVCVLPRGHRLASKRVVTAGDLNNEDFIGIDYEIVPMYTTCKIIEESGGTPNAWIETQRTHTACALVSAGMGATLIEPFTTLNFPSDRIVIRRFSPAIDSSCCMFISPNSPHTHLIQKIGDIAEETGVSLKREITERLDETS